MAWLATRTDKTAVTQLVRIAWRTVGRICQRVAADEIDEARLDELFEIGIDELKLPLLTHPVQTRIGRVSDVSYEVLSATERRLAGAEVG